MPAPSTLVHGTLALNPAAMMMNAIPMNWSITGGAPNGGIPPCILDNGATPTRPQFPATMPTEIPSQ